MNRVRSFTVMSAMLVLATAFVAVSQAQRPDGSRRGFGRAGRDSLLGLMRREQVRDELKLNEEQTTKVQEITETLVGEMREQFAALRDIEDRDERRAKSAELTAQVDQKAREQLRDVLEREQMMRLYQIRMQVRAVVDSLANQYVARRLELTDEQTKELAGIAEQSQSKQSEIFGTMRDATQEQRAEARQKLGAIRAEADEQALALLTSQQKETFESMKGEKFELQTRRRQR